MKERLLVSVTSGKYLKKKKQWVLVKLKLHGSKYKTKYVNGGEDVVFQKETFIFEVNEEVYPAGEMEIMVETWEMLSSGESFAFATVPLAPITAEIRTNIANGVNPANHSNHQKIYLEGFDEKPPSPTPTLAPSSLDKVIILKNKKQQQNDLNTSNSSNKSSSNNKDEENEEKVMCIILNFELVPENDSTTMKSLPLMFRWFPELPHNEQVISECYCTKQAKKMVGMSHSGTMYITQGYIGFRSPSHLAKNKKLLISFKDIKSIKKKIGSFYLPNAIQIRTGKKKYVFASFIHRSKAYKVLTSQWTLNGGGNNANDIEEDDDSNDDESNLSSLSTSVLNEEEDEEISMINNGHHQHSSNNPLNQQQLVRNLSPLPKSSQSSSSANPTNLAGSGTKKRSLSISLQAPSPNQLNSSPSRGTPTNPDTKDSFLPTTASTNIKISIEIEDYQILGCTSIITISVSNDSLVKDLLEKLKSKLFTNSNLSYEDQQQYILAKSKNKKSKRSSKRIMYSIDQLIDINSNNNNNGTDNNSKAPPSPQLSSDRGSINNIINNINNKDMIIPTRSVTLSHRGVKSNQINSSPSLSSTGGEKKFYILENEKVLSSYFSSSLTSPATTSSELLYFKKQIPVKEINLIFELVEDKLKTIKLILSVDTKISDIYREVSNYNSHKIYAEEYYFYLPKNSERGIVLQKEKTLRDYNITKSNSLIQVVKIPPFKSFIDKFKYFDKNDRNLLYELVQCCFSNSLPLMKPQDIENPQDFLDKLQQKLNIDDIEARTITKNLLINSSYRDEGILVELKSRMESLLLDANPYYSEFTFEKKELYETWKSIEINNLTRVMRSVIFKEDFIGFLFINVLEAENLKLNSNQQGVNCYLVLSSGEKLVKTTTIMQETDPIWSESFIIKIKKPRSKLEILVMNSVGNGKDDECIGIIELSIKDHFEDQLELHKDHWFNITSIHGTGRVHLSFEYQYQFQEYNKYLINVPKRQEVLKSSESLSNNTNPADNPTSSINNQHRCTVLHAPLYTQLLNFILERQEDFKLSKFKFSPLSSKRHSSSSTTPKFINPFDDTTNDDKEEDVWILGSFKMLLNQYSIRYGLSKSTTLAIQLSIMSERYSTEMKPSLASSTTALSNYSKNYIIELEEVLESIYQISTGDDLDNIFLKSEITTINSSVLPLMEQIKYTVGRYMESFPGNKPRGALKSLVNSLHFIIKIINFHNSEAPQLNFNQLLTKTIMVEQKKKFEENIAAMGFLQLDLQSKIKLISEISLMLVELIGIIQEEVNSTLKYEGSFPIDVKITCDLIDCWGSCILAVMEDFCSWAPYHPNILVLVKRILDYHNFTKSISMERFKPMPLKQLFVTYVYKLLKEIKSNLSRLCTNSIKKDDKRTLASITLGHSSSFIEFFNACDQSLKDFDSLMWLPDSFSFVQLLEVIASEVVHYVSDLKKEFEHYILHTEIESGDRPVLFTLNVEPCIIYNNIEQSIKKLEHLSQVINTNLSNNIKERKKQGETQQMDRTTKQCVEDSFKLCLDDTMKFINQTIQDLEDFLVIRIKNYLFYCFSSILFSEPLVLKNSHFTEPVVPSDQVEIVATNNGLEGGSLSTSYNSGNNTPTSTTGISSPIQQPPTQFVSIQSSQSNSSGSLMEGLSTSNSNNSVNPAKINARYEKMILSQIKEFLTPKIEELYGKLREQLFKPFIKKLWCQIVEELQYLFIQRPKEKILPFHKANIVILNFDQIAIVNSVLKELIVLFHRGGSGIATPILEEKLQPLRLLISLSEMDSTSLIDTYNQKSFSGTSSSSSSKPQPTKELVISVLATRVDFDKEARTFVNKINGVDEKPLVVDGTNVDISEIKVIPETEFIIDKYHCSYNGQLGLLIISSRYLGFHNLLRQVGVSIGNKISVALLNIVEVKKIKVALIFNAIQIKTNENKIYNFSGFLDRDTVYNDILHQIKVAQKNINKKQQKIKK
ncbi:hypothetical protein DICPUDRAFT_97228 [Dictyostelium purpureum]|uniref:C2 domain-containing protein n=1 Tax=Dictyostelium purpureum TaxID=5786 RepID=F0ZEW6_DICPU|nr:uncharacterized protein DICPUDRAFT_97228 [Dictyostelium purpureum]EGC37480.1 hypothetical protein DICPUDRAFT_97228 [Dictyostelium purpureum]|eukprot:XP_003285954.1 hypothetical protein DICPUDRAFT_97228 [Dictyostelium purpureum]